MSALPAHHRSCQRTTPRSLCAKPAHAELHGRWLACTITDISEIGMRIAFPLAVDLAPRFTVRERATGRTWQVELIWSGEVEAGLAFRGAASARGEAEPVS